MKTIQLREFQSKLITDTRTALAEGINRVIVQSHVGSGKTVVATEIIRRAIENRARVLFLAPRRQLIYQTVETLNEYSINCGVIMAGELKFSQPLVQVASFDTITARVGSGRMELPEADLCIVDEAHMCVSPARIKVLEHYKRVIGLTATPALGNGKGMGFFYKGIVESLTMQEMVTQGYLVPMRYYIGESPDLSGVKLNADGDFVEKQLAEINDQPKLIGAIFENWKRIAGDRTTLVFAVNRKHARHLHDEFASHGATVDYVDGETPPDDRERIRHDVESGKTQVIVNIGVLVAGVNWPRISCIVIARQMRNISNWIQCIGRGSRLHETKTDCIIIYHGSNFEELGMIDEPIEWSLDDKSTIRERKERAKKEAKEPKEITCADCGTVFKSRRSCPVCGHEMVKPGEPIPYHEADLKEVTKAEKVPGKVKEEWYQQMLGWCRRHGKKDGLAFYAYQEKFGIEPKWKKVAKEPSQEVINYFKHRAIKRSHAA
jgi:DNA repair protein RadD